MVYPLYITVYLLYLGDEQQQRSGQDQLHSGMKHSVKQTHCTGQTRQTETTHPPARQTDLLYMHHK